MSQLKSATMQMIETNEDNIIPDIQPFEIESPSLSGITVYSIKLHKDISKLNFISAQISSLAFTLHIFVTDTLQPFILLDKDYYNIDQDTSGTLLGILQVILLVTKIIGAFGFGHLIDRFGRRPMFLAASLMILVGCTFAPNQTSVFPGYLATLILIACGAVTLGNMPFIADYVHDDSKGKAAGISMTMAGIGAILGNLILKYFLYAGYSLGQIYRIWGVCAFVMFTVISFGIKGGKYYMNSIKHEDGTIPKEKFWKTLKEAFVVVNNSPWLIIGLIIQALGSSDFYILTTIFAIFIKNLFPPGTPDKVSDIKVSNIQTLTLAPSTIANVLFGIYIDRSQNIMRATYTSLIGGIIGFGLTISVQTPDDIQLYIAVVILGCILTGIFTVSAYLTTKHFPDNMRGILTGLLTAVGYFGYIVLALGGGYLYDIWMPSAPFIINIIVMVFVLIGITYIYKTRILTK